MRQRLLSALLACSIAPALPAAAQTLAHDNFDYTAPSLAGQSGGTGFSLAAPYTMSMWAEADFVPVPGLSRSGLVTSGNAITATGYALDYRTLPLANGANYGTTSGTLFASLLISPTAAPSPIGSYGGIALANYLPDPPYTQTGTGAPVFIGDIAGTYGLQQYGSEATAATTALSNTPATVGAVTLLVVRFSFSAGSALDTIDLFVNPDIASWTADTLPSATLSMNTDFNRLFIEQYDRSYTFDEFRLGSTFDSVAPFDATTPVPEPSTYVAGALSGAALIASQRRRLARLLARPRLKVSA